MKKGDTIKCKDEDDLIETHRKICALGYECDFLYKYKGQKGLWIIITKGVRSE